MTDHEDFLELAAIHALEALDQTDRFRFEAHLATGCESCAAALREARRVAGELSLRIAPIQPDAKVKQALLNRVRMDASRSAKTRALRSLFLPLAAAATLALAAGLAFHTRSLSQRLRDEHSSRLELESELQRLRESLDWITGPQTQSVSLAGQQTASQATARAFLDPVNGRILLYVYNIPPPPAGRTYQLWIILDGTPISAGTFGVAPNGSARLDAQPIPSFEGAVTVAVTVEPMGGVPQPTGPMVLLGS